MKNIRPYPQCQIYETEDLTNEKSMILAITLCLGMTVPAAATDITETGNGLSLEAQVTAIIEAEKEAVFASVYLQLEEQNALPLYDNYVQLLAPRIEKSVYDAYNFYPADEIASTYSIHSKRATRGGILYYTQMGSLVEIQESYFTPSRTANLYTAEAERQSVRQAIWENLGDALNISKEGLEWAPFLGLISDKICNFLMGSLGYVAFSVPVLLGIDKIMTTLPREQLKKYDDYSCVTDMYDPVENYKASVITAWTKHPYVEWDTNLIKGDVAFVEFEK